MGILALQRPAIEELLEEVKAELPLVVGSANLFLDGRDKDDRAPLCILGVSIGGTKYYNSEFPESVLVVGENLPPGGPKMQNVLARNCAYIVLLRDLTEDEYLEQHPDPNVNPGELLLCVELLMVKDVNWATVVFSPTGKKAYYPNLV